MRRNVIANNKLLFMTIITFCFVTLTRSEPLIWTEIPGRGWGRDLRSRSGQSRYSKRIIFFSDYVKLTRSWTNSSLSYTTYQLTYIQGVRLEPSEGYCLLHFWNNHSVVSIFMKMNQFQWFFPFFGNSFQITIHIKHIHMYQLCILSIFGF